MWFMKNLKNNPQKFFRCFLHILGPSYKRNLVNWACISSKIILHEKTSFWKHVRYNVSPITKNAWSWNILVISKQREQDTVIIGGQSRRVIIWLHINLINNLHFFFKNDVVLFNFEISKDNFVKISMKFSILDPRFTNNTTIWDS